MLSYFITEIVEDEKICDWSVLTERINLVDLRNIKERPGLISFRWFLIPKTTAEILATVPMIFSVSNNVKRLIWSLA